MSALRASIAFVRRLCGSAEAHGGKPLPYRIADSKYSGGYAPILRLSLRMILKSKLDRATVSQRLTAMCCGKATMIYSFICGLMDVPRRSCWLTSSDSRSLLDFIRRRVSRDHCAQ